MRNSDLSDSTAALDAEHARLIEELELVTSRLHASYAARRTTASQLRAVIGHRNAARREVNRLRAEVHRLGQQKERLERLLHERSEGLQSAIRVVQELRAGADNAERQALARIAGTASAVPLPVASPLGRARQRLRDAHLPLQWLTRHPLRFARGVLRLRHQAFRARVAELAASGLFDVAHYRVVTGAGPDTNLVARFILGGDVAGESPHPLFDPAWYRTHNAPIVPDVPPLLHYLRGGGWEMRSPHPLFDAGHYVSQWPAGTVTGVTPLTHFVGFGGRAGASPHPLFDTAYYLAQRPDLVAAGANPLLHYLATATAEMVDPHPLFSTRYYLTTQPDVTPQNPLEHFVRYGALEGRSPHPLFDIGHYWSQRADVRDSSLNPLLHYLAFGARESSDPHPLFHTSYYLEQVEALGELGVNPLVHFLRWGWRDGLRPNPWFDPAFYLRRNPDVVNVNPLVHFMEHGWREGRDPSAEFSIAAYFAKNPDVAAADVNPLVHYLTIGRAEGRAGVEPGPSYVRAAALRFNVHGTARAGRTIMCVGHVSPWPVAAGNQYALSRLLHYFQDRGYRIVLVLAPIPSEPLAPGALEQLAAEFGNVVICEPSGKVEFRLRDVPDVLTPLGARPVIDDFSAEPGPDLNYCHDALMAVVARLLDAVGATAVLAQYIFMTRLFTRTGPDTLRIVHTHDVFSQKAANVVAYGISDAQITEADEARLLNRADVVMAVTPEDAAVLRRLAPTKDIVLNKVDVAVRRNAGWAARPVAFLPASGNHLNVTGLRDFLKFAWPRVRQAVPDAVLRVAGGAGRSVPPGTPGVVALGHVPDLGAEYATARVVINPAVAGTGLKIKTVEALAQLRPVIGWPHNRDGLAPALLRFVDEVTDWHAFADTVVRWLSADRSPFDAQAIETIASELSPSASYGELEDRVVRYFAGVEASARQSQ